MFLTVYKLSYKLQVTSQHSIDPSPGRGEGRGGGRGGGWGWKIQNRTTHVQTNIPLIHLLAGVGWGEVGWMGMQGTKQNNPRTNQYSIDPSPGGGGGGRRWGMWGGRGWMRMEGTKQNNPCTSQYSIDPSPGGGGGCWGRGGGWGWKVQNRTTHVQTNITLIHLLAGVGGGGWMGMEGTKQNNSCTNQHSVDSSPGGGGWGWKVQNRTPHVQTNIPFIHLLVGVGVRGWMGMEGTKQNNPCTN